MTLYDELIARGLIAQVTNEEEIKNMINNGKATFYIGFDCTADSLHVGHFMALCLMKRLQMAGNKPIALIGDGTTLIGDPSGRTDMRQMLTEETIKHNAECFKRQMERFIEFGEGKAMMLNNAEWLMNLNYIELLREVASRTDAKVTASGGISKLDDLRNIKELAELGVDAAILGKSLYARAFTLEEALEVAR